MTIETLHPKSRDEWLALRRRDVTASQIAACVAAHPYTTPFQLWAEKTGAVRTDDAHDTPALKRGRYLESVAARLVVEAMPQLAIAAREPFEYWRDSETRIGATPDLIATDPARGPGVVQIKTIEPSTFRARWRDGGSSHQIEPPLWVALQAMTEAKLTGAQWAMIAALRVAHGLEFDLIEVPIHDGAWKRLQAAVRDFWQLVDNDQPPPPDYQRDGKLLAAVYPDDDGQTIDLSHDNELCVAVATREQLKADARQIDTALEPLDALIRHRAGSAQRMIAGEYVVTLKRESVKAYTVAAKDRRPLRVRAARPDA